MRVSKDGKTAGEERKPGAPLKLRRGEMLFAEGDTSKAMYLIKRGAIRLFKKKGDSAIELDTVRSGAILGELAFLDGNPRSAGAEAILESEVIEISGPQFAQALTASPEWVKILLKTIVSRLRAASNKIRQLETASVSYEGGEKGKAGSPVYAFLSTSDVLKTMSCVLLVGLRYGGDSKDALELKESTLSKYVNQVSQVPLAKMTAVLDLLTQANIVKNVEKDGETKAVLVDTNFLDGLIGFMNDQNLLEPTKRAILSSKGFVVMSLLVKHMSRYQKDEASGKLKANIAEVSKLEEAATGSEPFRLDEVPELAKLGFIEGMEMKSGTEVYTLIDKEKFLIKHRVQNFIKLIETMNEQKRKGNLAGRSV